MNMRALIFTDSDRYVLGAESAAIGIALFVCSVALALWANHPKGPQGAAARSAMLLGVCVLLISSTRLLQAFGLFVADIGVIRAAELLQSIIMVAAGVVFWILFRRLVTGPSRLELQKSNARLKEIQRELQEGKANLERIVGERTRDLSMVNAMFNDALTCTNVQVFHQDADLRYTWLINDVYDLDVIGRTDCDLNPGPDGESLMAVKQEVIRTGVSAYTTTKIEIGDNIRWFDVVIHRCKWPGHDGRYGVIGSATEITHMKQNEHKLEAVAAEYSHRMKNLLGVVLGIAQQTARTMNVSPAYTKALFERIRALSDAAELMSGEQGAELGALANKQLGHLLTAFPGRVRILGEATYLKSSAAQFMALALHELGTNAQKYGALSGETGNVSLLWAREADELKLTWTERGGPVPTNFDARGFGRGLLETLVPKGVRGKATFDLSPEGLTWTVTMPLAPKTTPVENREAILRQL